MANRFRWFFLLLLVSLLAACANGDTGSVGNDIILQTDQTESDTRTDDGTCTPSCENRECGDDGCGGTCGQCVNPCTGQADSGLCANGSCATPFCCPDCAGKECGDNGCGGTCGECTENGDCIDGSCICTPDCDGKTCGEDGCGGNCGVCGPKQECNGGTCECLYLECENTCCFSDEVCYEGACCKATCDGVECGLNNCGEPCGDCPEGDVCVANECCTPDCTDKECGPDGCGGSCGDCDGLPCEDFICCVPDCDGKECGPDGCGGECGQCPNPMDACEEGICQKDPSSVGCSDGTREGFLSMSTYPLLAACGGAWDIPGIHNDQTACERKAGNDGENPDGLGCNVTDLCAEGWHVCLGRNDVDYRSNKGCDEIMDGAESPAFFLVRTSSTGAMNCAPDTIGSPSSVNDLFGCGDLGCPANADSCEPLTRGSHDLCKSIRNKPTSSCECYFLGELPPSDPSYVEGDFENVKCTPNSGGCGWCKPLDYFNKLLGVAHPDAWDCGSSTTQEANNVTKSFPDQQGGVLCCMDQCETDDDCGADESCIMATCQEN